jgi:hypothetical protein
MAETASVAGSQLNGRRHAAVQCAVPSAQVHVHRAADLLQGLLAYRTRAFDAGLQDRKNLVRVGRCRRT